jgi:hypothetical protein
MFDDGTDVDEGYLAMCRHLDLSRHYQAFFNNSESFRMMGAMRSRLRGRASLILVSWFDSHLRSFTDREFSQLDREARRLCCFRAVA